MTTNRYEILESLPTSGPMYVPVTEDGDPFYSEGVAIRFLKSDGTDWVANFRPGWTNLTHVLELSETPNLLVIAGGICYLMSPDNAKPIDVFGVSYSELYDAGGGRYILQNEVELTVLEPDGKHWNSPRISWDGLEVRSVEKGTVTGLAYDPMYDSDEWVKFTFDIDAKVLTGGSYYRDRPNRPWWKFW